MKIKSKHKFMFSVLFFYCHFLNYAVCEIMWKNIVQRDWLQMTIWRMRFAFWINEATHTDTHSEYVIYIDFPRQQWLREHVSMFPHRYIACLELCQCRKHTAVATCSSSCILHGSWDGAMSMVSRLGATFPRIEYRMPTQTRDVSLL